MKRFLTLLLILVTVCSYASMRGGAQYDPGAARTNLSNVDAAATPSMASITLSDKVRAAWADILGDIYASGTAKVATGTAAAPAYSFSSDPDTGIYSAGANEIGFSSGGVDKLRLTSDNDVGIGTTTPKMVVSDDARELHLVAGSGQVAGVRLETIDGQNAEFFVPPGGVNAWGFYSSSNIPFLLYTNNAERMKITASGNVLIGTSTDDGANKLQVNGGVKITGAVTKDSKLAVIASGATVTIFTVSRGATYLITTYQQDLPSVSTAHMVFVAYNSDTVTLRELVAGANWTITASGLNVQLTNNTGADRGYRASILQLY